MIANKWQTKDNTGYIDLLKQGYSEKEILDKLGYHRMCCRRMFLTHEDNIKKINY